MTTQEINEIKLALCDGCNRTGKYCPDCEYYFMIKKLKSEAAILDLVEKRSRAGRAKK